MKLNKVILLNIWGNYKQPKIVCVALIYRDENFTETISVANMELKEFYVLVQGLASTGYSNFAFVENEETKKLELCVDSSVQLLDIDTYNEDIESWYTRQMPFTSFDVLRALIDLDAKVVTKYDTSKLQETDTSTKFFKEQKEAIGDSGNQDNIVTIIKPLCALTAAMTTTRIITTDVIHDKVVYPKLGSFSTGEMKYEPLTLILTQNNYNLLLKSKNINKETISLVSESEEGVIFTIDLNMYDDIGLDPKYAQYQMQIMSATLMNVEIMKLTKTALLTVKAICSRSHQIADNEPTPAYTPSSDCKLTIIPKIKFESNFKPYITASLVRSVSSDELNNLMLQLRYSGTSQTDSKLEELYNQILANTMKYEEQGAEGLQKIDEEITKIDKLISEQTLTLFRDRYQIFKLRYIVSSRTVQLLFGKLKLTFGGV